MKIYVITEGEYSDYHIITATTDEEAAKALAKKFGADVEEYDDGKKILKMRSLYFIRFDKSGSAKIIRNVTNVSYFYNEIGVCCGRHGGGVDVTIEADSEERAIKVAAEKRAKYLAEKEGIA